MTAFERYNRPLTETQRDRYLAEQAVIGRMGGAGDIPETAADLSEYVEAMRPKLAVNEQTREFFEFLLSSPFGMRLPGPLARHGNRFQVESGMGLMPRWAQELTGFAPSAAAWRTLHEPSLRTFARSLRWAFGTPPFRALAEERATSARSSVPAAAGERQETSMVRRARRPVRLPAGVSGAAERRTTP